MEINTKPEETLLMLPFTKPKPKKTRRYLALIVVGSLTCFYAITEITISIKLDSIALLSDGIHNLSDVISLGIAFWALYKSTTSRTDKMTYGWRRTEILGAVMNGCSLVALCLFIFLEAIPRIFIEPKAISTDWWFIGTAAAGLGVNTIGTILFSLLSGGHGHVHAGGGDHGHSHGGDDNHGHSHKKKKNKIHHEIDEEIDSKRETSDPSSSQVELSTEIDIASSYPGYQSRNFQQQQFQSSRSYQGEQRELLHHPHDDNKEKKQKKESHDHDHDHKEKKHKKESHDHDHDHDHKEKKHKKESHDHDHDHDHDHKEKKKKKIT